MSQIVRIPLLHDHHTHPLFYSAFARAVNLQDVTDQKTANRLLREGCDRNAPGITVAYGWRNNLYQWSPAELESLPPAAIFNVSLHSLAINQQGLDVLRRRYGSVVEQLADLSWYESNLRVVLNWFANLNASVESLKYYYDQLLQQGVWTAEELLLVDEHEISLFDQAGLADRTRFWAAPDTFANLSEHMQSRITGLKLFTDGAIGSKTAAISGHYLGESENRGMLIYTDDALATSIQDCLETGKALAIHAIGDRAIEQCVLTLENLGLVKSGRPEIRLEHVQLINQDMAARAKRLGLVLSMQPNFSIDSQNYSDRLSKSACQANNPFRMLIDDFGFKCGKDLIFGSDGMPHGIDDALKQSLFPVVPNQTLSMDEFRAGYCLPDDSHGYIEIELGVQNIEYKVHTNAIDS